MADAATSVPPPPPVSSGGAAVADAASQDIGPIDNDTTGAPAKFDYDFFVIGGGSGGLACAKTASQLGPYVGLADYVNPTQHGTKWGVGGTCVNVGCIPKKLFHTAALTGETLHDEAYHYGWRLADEEARTKAEAAAAKDAGEFAVPTGPKFVCDWSVARANIDAHVRSINYGYEQEFRVKDIDYHNRYASFVDRWTVELKNAKGEVVRKTARRFLLATGGRPAVPSDVPGAKELAITSDDIFWWKKDPKKCLVVGASYVALECAGFLTGLGRPTTVAIRSIPLRGFDQQMAGMVVDEMKRHGTRFLQGAVPTHLERKEGGNGMITVTFKGADSAEFTEDFDTVLYATGRAPETTAIGIDKLGMQIDGRSKKIVVDKWGRTSVPNIYAIGDIVKDGLELTPVAIRAGQLIAEALWLGGTKTMDYHLVPTTVFTPIEYGAIGLPEEDAEKKYGADNLEVYHSYFTPLESIVAYEQTGFERLGSNRCYLKLVCNKADKGRVVGFHYFGPQAGNVTQGFGTAMRLGATYEDIYDTIGIHPTVAEEVNKVKVTKRSGLDAKPSSC